MVCKTNGEPNLLFFKTSKYLNDLDLKSYKTQQSLALQKETRDPVRCLTGLLLFFFLSEEWFNCRASMIKIIICHQGYICFLVYTADNYNKLLLSSTSCTEVAFRSHEAGP